jgi:hypothetical protein
VGRHHELSAEGPTEVQKEKRKAYIALRTTEAEAIFEVDDIDPMKLRGRLAAFMTKVRKADGAAEAPA